MAWVNRFLLGPALGLDVPGLGSDGPVLCLDVNLGSLTAGGTLPLECGTPESSESKPVPH